LLNPIPDYFPGLLREFLHQTGLTVLISRRGLPSGPQSLAGQQEAFLFSYDPMIARGLAKAILNSVVLLKTVGIEVKNFCHSGFEPFGFRPIARPTRLAATATSSKLSIHMQESCVTV